MSKRQVAKWIEINIGDSTNSGSDTILRYALGGIDVTHDGNVFKADGNLTSIGNIEQSLGFRKTSLTVKLNSTNLTNLAHVNALKYRNKPVKVWIGLRGTDGSITSSTVKQIFGGQVDTHDVGRKYITIKSQPFWARFEQPSGTRTSTAAQAFNIKNSVYDVATTTVDKGFEFADRDYSDLILGKVPARTVTHSQQVWNGKRGGWLGIGSKKYDTITSTEYIPGREGEILGDDGSDYTRPIVFGRAHVQGNLILASNPTQAEIDAVYPSMTSTPVPEGTTAGTKYISMLFAIAEGPLHDISVIFNGLSSEATFNTVNMGDNATGTLRDSNNNVFGIVETKLGSYNQTAFTNLVSLSSDWTNDHRCIGTGLVMLTFITNDNFSDGFPDFIFNVGGKIFRQVETV